MMGVSAIAGMPAQENVISGQEQVAATHEQWAEKIEQVLNSMRGSSCAAQLSDEIENFVRNTCSIREALYIQRDVRQPFSRLLLACCDAALVPAQPWLPFFCSLTPSMTKEKSAMLIAWIKGFRGDLEGYFKKIGITLVTASPTLSKTALSDAERLIKTLQEVVDQPGVLTQEEVAFLASALAKRLSLSDMKALESFCKTTTFDNLKDNWRNLVNEMLRVCGSDIRL
jgi:hypothetical protein